MKEAVGISEGKGGIVIVKSDVTAEMDVGRASTCGVLYE